MEMNLDPGWNAAVINLRGPCKLDVMRDESTVTTVEVPPGETCRLIVKRGGKKPKDFVARVAGKISE